jgi:hypothetical protein
MSLSKLGLTDDPLGPLAWESTVAIRGLGRLRRTRTIRDEVASTPFF